MANAAGRRLDPATLKKFWKQVDAADWVNMLRLAHPGNRWTYTKKLIKGLCPFHTDKDPSFQIDLEKGYAKCFSANCGKFFWDPIRFYAEVQATPITYVAAAEDMRARYNIGLPKKAITEISRLQEHREMKRIVLDILRGELCDAISLTRDPATLATHPRMAYAKDTVKYLLDERAVPNVFHLLPMGIIPPEQRMEKLVDEYVRLHKVQFKNPWATIREYFALAFSDVRWIGALMFVTGTTPHDPGRIKLRRVPNPAVPEDQQKDILLLPDELDHDMGFFGLYGTPSYLPHFATHNIKTFYLVEGEFDALSVFARQFEGNATTFVIFSGGGGSVENLDSLANFGFESVHVIGDGDAGGDGYAKTVLRSTKVLCPRIFQWAPTLTHSGKIDPDLFVRTQGLDAFQKEVLDPKNYLKPHQWVEKQAHIQMAEYESGDVRSLSTAAVTWGTFIQNEAERIAFTNAMVARYNLDPAALLSAMALDDDDEEAFIIHLRESLARRLTPLEALQNGKNPGLRVWDKTTRKIYELTINDKQNISSNVSLLSRTDLLTYIRGEMGVPQFLEITDPKKFTPHDYLRKTDKLTLYLLRAVEQLTMALPDASNVQYLGPGIHCVLEGEGKEADMRLYLANGDTLYRGDFLNADYLQWQELPGPMDKDVVLFLNKHTAPARVYPHVKSADDLNKTPQYTLPELFDLVYTVISKGWDFKSHELTSEYLTALLLSLPIASCIPLQPYVMFTSDQSGGKSSVIGGLFGKTHLPSVNLLHGSVYMDNYTVAGIQQSMNHSSQTLCLDEFEDRGGNDRKSQHVRNVLHLLRGYANESGGIVQGTVTGVARSFKFHCPVILAGIRTPQDAADLSRVTLIEMARKVDRESPATIISQLFTAKKMAEIRDAIPTTVAHHAYKWRQMFYQIAEEFKEGSSLSYGKMTRNRQQYYGAMAMMALCGRDYKTWVRNYFCARRNLFERVATSSLSNDVFQELMSTPAIRIGEFGDNTPQSLGSILSSDKRNLLNTSQSGAFFDEKTGWLVVHWAAIKRAVITSLEYRDRSAAWLKEQTSRLAYTISDDSVRSSGALERLKPYMGLFADIQSISVFNIAELSEAVTQANEPTLQRGIENFNMMKQYAEQLAAVNFDTPPSGKKGGNGHGGNGHGGNGHGGNGHGGSGNGSGGGGLRIDNVVSTPKAPGGGVNVPQPQPPPSMPTYNPQPQPVQMTYVPMPKPETVSTFIQSIDDFNY